jgi:uncharacterized protein (DUF1501 family)
MNPITRRNFLGQLFSLAGSTSLPLAINLAAMGSAAAQTASDYKAIICLNLTGGNDHFNTVLPTDSTSWNAYRRIRSTSDAGSIALPGVGAIGGVIPIAARTVETGRTFALHPSLAPIKPLFEAGRVGILANVGTLIRPLTLAQYKANEADIPPRLFSHNDQTATWQSSGTESSASAGWGGRMGDIIAGSNGNAGFTCISSGGNALFLAGRAVRQYQISGVNAVPIGHLNDSLFGASAAANPLRQIVTADHSDLFRKEYAAVVNRAIASQATLSAAMPAAGRGVPDPTLYLNPISKLLEINPLAVQLQTVARIIGGRGTLGMRRQVFYVNHFGFDTHDAQLSKQAILLAQLAHAMAYFDSLMSNLQGVDMRKQVTLFTASEFGRTFTSNGDGTDHGWGAHHFIMGGAVKGGSIYGSVPDIGLKHSLDVGSGALLPTISVDQYGATLASWFGLSATQIADVFPNIGNFSVRNLGFMNAA